MITFESDPQLAQRAADAAQEMVDVAMAHYHLRLDFSDASVEQIEAFAVKASQDRPTSMSARQFEAIASAMANDMGAYIGEVYRRNHGATWGQLNDRGGATSPGMRADHQQMVFWPMAKAYQRLVNGPDDNLWHYYQGLVRRTTSPDNAATSASPGD